MTLNFFKKVLLISSLFLFSHCSVVEQKTDCELDELSEVGKNLIFTGPLIINQNLKNEIDAYPKEEPDFLDAVDAMTSNQCLFRYSSDKESWNELRGITGFIIIENGKIISVLVTGKS